MGLKFLGQDGFYGWVNLVVIFFFNVALMLAYSIIYGISGGIGSVAVGNLYPDYFGRTEFPKIMKYDALQYLYQQFRSALRRVYPRHSRQLCACV